MAQTIGVAVPGPQQPDRPTVEQPLPKGTVVPMPGAAQGKDAKEQGLSDQDMIAILSLLLM